MSAPGDPRWDRHCRCVSSDPGTGLSVDVGLTGLPDTFVEDMTTPVAAAFSAMASLEAGGLANADEGRAVGHYWLRAPELAPSAALAREIRDSWKKLSDFAARARHRFDEFVHIGIGGSATGARMLSQAWPDQRGRGRFPDGAFPDGVFLDNADPDEVARVLRLPAERLDRTLVSVVSKSGITPTPWQVMLEAERIFARAGVDFARHAVATTTAGSALAELAGERGWLEIFPLWEWVGGRTSVTSMAGLLPAALAGADTSAFLDGAASMDSATRVVSVRENPAAMLALTWFWLGSGRGEKAMVVLPYRDRLTAVVRWLQQLVMESVGKRLDRAGRVVEQGLTVYGHKGVSDQHSYLQQLRDGRADFFATLIGVHRDEGVPNALSDHLFGNLLGTLTALDERGRPVVLITLPDGRERSLGALVALFERAVGLYAELIDVNAYHQPGVDKHVALPMLELRNELLGLLAEHGEAMTAVELADATGQAARPDVVHRLLDHLAVARPETVGVTGARSPASARYFVRKDHHVREP
jgi:glucose-6-phosphate isomerase